MKMIILSAVAVLALGFGAALILSSEQQAAYQAYSTSGARVGEPGHNLVGPSWDGRNS
jgi:ubiquinone biosynthesis protein Coq4